MTNSQLTKKIREIYEANKDDWERIGVRFEDRLYSIGDICDYSRDNPDRDDERDFPEYGTPEYNDLPELNGTCAWEIDDTDKYTKSYQAYGAKDGSDVAVYAEHCYIIAGDYWTYGDDVNEIIIRDAVILDVIF